MRKKITAAAVLEFVQNLQSQRMSVPRIVDHLNGFETAAEYGGILTHNARLEIENLKMSYSTLASRRGAPIGKTVIDLFPRQLFRERGDSRV